MQILKPPMLTGDNSKDNIALRDWMFQLARSLESMETATISEGSIEALTRAGSSGDGGLATKKEIKDIRQNARELRSLIIKTADSIQTQIDNIETRNFYVKYADDFSGSYPPTMYNTPTSNTEYMGVCTSTGTTAPTDPSVYTWSKIKGNQGPQGIQGAPGANGFTPYLHIKYSDDGETFTINPDTGIADGETVGSWIGTYTDYTQTDSMTFSDYTWHRFADDAEIMTEIADAEQRAYDYTDSKTEVYNELYVAQSDYGTFVENIDTRIEVGARNTIETYNYQAAIDSLQDSIDLAQSYFTRIDGEIRRGIVLDPTTNEYVVGIAISEALQFEGECGADDPNNPGDGYTYYYLTDGQTFGLYTSTGWQFWIDGAKRGWFDSVDNTLHVYIVYVEGTLILGGYWQAGVSPDGAEFQLEYIGG